MLMEEYLNQLCIRETDIPFVPPFLTALTDEDDKDN